MESKTVRIFLSFIIFIFLNSSDAVALDPHLQKALKSFQSQKFGETISHLKRVPKNARDENYWFVTGNAYFLQKKYKPALKAYQRAFTGKGILRLKSIEYAIRSARSARLFKSASRIVEYTKNESISSPGIKKETQALIDDVTLSATDLYQSERYAKALEQIERIERFGRSDPLILLKGMSLAALGLKSQATKNLRIAQKSEDQEIKARATELLEQLHSTPSTPSFRRHLFGRLGFGYDSNVLQDGQSEETQKRATGEAQIGLNYRLLGDHLNGGYVRYNLFHSEPIGLALYRYLTQSAQIHARFKLGDIQIQPLVGTDIDLLGSDFILLTPNAGMTINVPLSDKIQISARYSFRRLISLDELFDYQTGNNHYITAELSYFNRNIYVSGFMDYLVDNSQDLQLESELLPTRFRGFGPGFYLLWIASQKWQFSLTYSYLYKTFDNTSGDERIDNRYRSELEARYRINPKLSVFSNTRFIRNVSSFGSTNADDKNYSQVISVLGIMWESFN